MAIDLFAYLEVDDFARFRAQMAATEVNDRWQAEMAELIDPLTDPATGFHQRLEEIFRSRLSRVDPGRAELAGPGLVLSPSAVG